MHMLQHMMLSYFMPPLRPAGHARVARCELVGTGRAYRVLKWLCFPGRRQV